MCVESRGRDSPYREQCKIDAVVPQLQFDYRYMGDGSRLQNACFLVEADTSSGAIHAPMLMRRRPNWCATWLAFCLHADKEGVLQLLLDKVARECCPDGQHWQILRQVSPTQSHQSNGSAEKAVSTVRGLARTYLAILKEKIAGSPPTQCEKRHTNGPVRKDSRTEIQETDPATGRTSSRSLSRSQRQSASAAMGNRPLVGTGQTQ